MATASNTPSTCGNMAYGVKVAALVIYEISGDASKFDGVE
jgi:hypothetical protein